MASGLDSSNELMEGEIQDYYKVPFRNFFRASSAPLKGLYKVPLRDFYKGHYKGCYEDFASGL